MHPRSAAPSLAPRGRVRSRRATRPPQRRALSPTSTGLMGACRSPPSSSGAPAVAMFAVLARVARGRLVEAASGSGDVSARAVGRALAAVLFTTLCVSLYVKSALLRWVAVTVALALSSVGPVLLELACSLLMELACSLLMELACSLLMELACSWSSRALGARVLLELAFSVSARTL